MARLLEIHRARLADKARENHPKAPEAPLLENPARETGAIPDGGCRKRILLYEIKNASAGFLMTLDVSPQRKGFIHYKHCGPGASESLLADFTGLCDKGRYEYDKSMMDALMKAGMLHDWGYPKDHKGTSVIFRSLGDVSWFGLVKVPVTREDRRDFSEDESKGRNFLFFMALKMPQVTMERVMEALKKEPAFGDEIYRELFPQAYEHIRLGALTPMKILVG